MPFNHNQNNQKTFEGTIKAYHFDIPKNEAENGKIKPIELTIKEVEKWESTIFIEKDSQNLKMSDALNLDPRYVRHVDFIGANDKGIHSYEFKDLMINYLIRSLIIPTLRRKFSSSNLPKSGVMVIDGPYKWHGVWLYKDGNKYVHYVNL